MTPSKEDPYFIEVDTIGCTHCGHGQSWNVIGPDGAALGTSYTNEEDAAELAEMLTEAFNRGATDRDRLTERVRELGKKSDAEMLRVKACEHIAEGEEGWEYLRNICPSTMAIATLRDKLADAEAKLQYDWDQGARTAKDMTAVNRAVGVERGIDIPEKFNALTQRLEGMARTTDEFVQLLQNCEAISENNHEQLVTRTLPVLCDKFIKAQQALEGKS